MTTTALVWFRRDLRVHDHPGLTAAHRECDRVVPASDVSSFAMARDRRVEAALEGVDVRRQPGLFVADVGRVRTQDGRAFSVFTPFHRAWERAPRREVHGAPRRLAFPSGLAVGRLPAAPEPEATDPTPPSTPRCATCSPAAGCTTAAA